MRWDEIGNLECSVARTLSVIGDRWTMLIVRDAFLGTRRFEAFQASLGLTRHRLADRLKRLTDEGIFERVPYREHPTRFEYKLTAKGRDLYPVLISLVAWGNRWMAGEAGPPVEHVHVPCGTRATPHLTCPGCGEPVDPRQMRAEIGPGLASS